MLINTDKKTININLNGNIKIANPSYPSFGYKDIPFNIIYDIYNTGGNSNYYSQILTESDRTLIERVTGSITTNEYISILHTITINDLGNYKFIIEVGTI
jgi:hypothetical protein